MRSSAAATVTSLDPWPIATSKRRRRAQRARAALRLTSPSPLLARRPPRWRPIAVCAMPKPLAQLQGLGEVARGDLHLVAVLAHRPDQRAHDEHVGGVGQVDPDAHASTTSRDRIVGEAGAHRQGEAGAGGLVRARQLGRGEPGHGRLAVHGHRGSSRARRSPCSASVAGQLVGALAAHHVEVVGVLGARHRPRQLHVLAQAVALVGRRRLAPRRGSSRRARAAGSAAPPPAARRAGCCSPPPRTSSCRRTRGSAGAAPAAPRRRRR